MNYFDRAIFISVTVGVTRWLEYIFQYLAAYITDNICPIASPKWPQKVENFVKYSINHSKSAKLS